MKRILLLLVILIPTLAAAQVENVLEIVAADRHKASGGEGPYRFDAPALTPSPEGYAPFYISHYGRHGSRYAWSQKTYTYTKEILDVAAGAGALTPLGKQLHRDFLDFYLIPMVNYGDLVDLGWEQHAHIASQMAADFPEVFAEGGNVLARASTAPRAIVSMNAFTVGLQKAAPKITITGSSLHTEMPSTIPTSTPKEIRKVYAGEVPLPETSEAFTRRTVDLDAILGRIFTRRDFITRTDWDWRLLTELYRLWGGYHNYCDSDFLEDVFTKEAVLTLWEADNYDLYCDHAAARWQNLSLLEDILARAAAAIEGKGNVADLRFGHDTCFNALRPLLNVNGCGYMPDKAEDVKYWFQTYDTPKAGNIQIVLYRSAEKKDPILFKLLLNGAEATLPQLTPVSGPYYRWDDFTAWAAGVLADHPVIEETE